MTLFSILDKFFLDSLSLRSVCDDDNNEEVVVSVFESSVSKTIIQMNILVIILVSTNQLLHFISKFVPFTLEVESLMSNCS